MARVTGLEPATSGVTGRRSNQLSYTRLRRRRALGIRSLPCQRPSLVFCRRSIADVRSTNVPSSNRNPAMSGLAGGREDGLAR